VSLAKLALTAAAFLFAAAGAAYGQMPFRVINPPQPTDSDKIEVIEFFWYGCPHCYHLEPVLNAWEKGLQKDVVFKRVPGTVGSWQNLAPLYYTIEAMGLQEQLHSKIFEAIHRDRINLGNAKLRDEWLTKQGVDLKKYAEVEKSFSVMTKLARAKQLGDVYKVDSVPQIIVNGKFLVSAETAGGQERMIPAVDSAIAMARREKAAAASPATPTPATAKR
jgi:thiol:disulfide interchange protein DsbA